MVGAARSVVFWKCTITTQRLREVARRPLRIFALYAERTTCFWLGKIMAERSCRRSCVRLRLEGNFHWFRIDRTLIHPDLGNRQATTSVIAAPSLQRALFLIAFYEVVYAPQTRRGRPSLPRSSRTEAAFWFRDRTSSARKRTARCCVRLIGEHDATPATHRERGSGCPVRTGRLGPLGAVADDLSRAAAPPIRPRASTMH
jgi:hypothetical protein